MKNKNMIGFFDIETSTNKYYENGNEYVLPQVYLCNLVLIEEQYMDKINKDNIQIIRNNLQNKDANKYQCYSYFFRTLEDFINFAKKFEDEIIIYVHNLPFEFSYLVEEYKIGVNHNKSIFRGKDPLKVVINDMPKVEFRDSLALLRKSIKDLGEDIGLPKLTINYNRNLYYYSLLFGNDFDYNERDNIITMLSIADFFQNKAPIIGVNKIKDLSITSTRFFKYYRKFFADKHFPKKYDGSKARRNNSLDEDYEFYNISRMAFRGGLVSVNPLYVPDDYNDNFWSYNSVYHIDVTSSYIYTMLNTKFPYFSKDDSVKIKNKKVATGLIKFLCNEIKENGSDFLHDAGSKINTSNGISRIRGFYAKIKLKNLRMKYDFDIPSIDSVRTSLALDKYCETYHGKITEADELEMYVNDAVLESIMIDYDFDDIECSYIIYTTKADHLPYYEIVYIMQQFFTKQLLKNNKNTKSTDYLIAKSGLNAMYGIKVENPIKDKVAVRNNKIVVTQKANSLTNNNNQILFNEYVINNKNKKTDIYSDGVYISTISRLNLIKMKKYLKDTGCMNIYCDTDSLMFEITNSTEKEVFDKIKKYNNEISKNLLSKDWIKEAIKMLSKINGEDKKHIKDLLSDLGNWDIESVDENGNIKPYEAFSTLGAKKYCKVKNGKVDTTISGLSKKIGNLIEDYSKQQKITVIEAAEEIFKNNTTFDETCSGKTNIIKTTLDKNIINNLRDENNAPVKGYGGNLIEKTSFNLNSKSDDSLQKNMLTVTQTVSVQKGIIKII